MAKRVCKDFMIDVNALEGMVNVGMVNNYNQKW